ncbi:hypothetical protein D9M69_665110 [compost metagenome]
MGGDLLVVLMVGLGHDGHGQAVLVLFRAMQRDAVLLPGQVFAADPDTAHVVVHVDGRSEIPTPAAGLHERSGVRQVQGQAFKVVAPHESPVGVERHLVGNHRGDVETPVHVDRLAVD